MKKITVKEINDELTRATRPTLYTNLPIPLNDLSDRCFEILVYHIFKERLKIRDSELIKICDNVSLMQGVAEQGRDIILSKNGLNSGVVQCKKYKSNFTKPEVSQEILKFVLYYLEDNALIGDISNFTYFLTVSTGFTGSAIGAFNNFSTYLVNEPKLKEWTEGIFKDYPSKFKGWTYDSIEEKLKEVITKIEVRKIIPPDIEYWISEFESLNKIFFRVLSVTDNTLLEQVVKSYLKPILHKLSIDDLNTPDYTFRFKEYLKSSFEIFSSAKTLVFGNQQKKLEEIYYPLTVIKKSAIKKGEKEEESHKIDKFSDDFIPFYKKVIIVDDGGMGKSTLLKWLFLSCVKLNKGVPIFIELRNITEDNNLLEEITNKLNPLNKVIERNATAEILTEKGFIFLFDGYDEIKFTNREFVTKDLEDFISKCPRSYFVLTSRPEKSLLSFSGFQEFSVRKLHRNEAFELIKKIDNYQERSQRLIEQIEQNHISGIEEFLGNPLLVSLLYKKFEYRETIPFKKQEFFYEVFEALFQAHDLSKGGSYIREKESKLTMTDFFQILRGIGYYCIKEGIQFNEAQLSILVEKVSSEFSKIVDTNLFINDITKAVPLFQRDGLSIRWAHKSIQQYFAAEYICRDSKEKQRLILLALYDSENIESYIQILELCYEIDYKTFKSSILKKFCQDYLALQDKMFPKIRRAKKIPQDEIDERCASTYNLNFFLFKEGDQDGVNIDSLMTNVLKKFNLEISKLAYFGLLSDDGLRVGTTDYVLLDNHFLNLLVRQQSDLISRGRVFSSDEFNKKAFGLPVKPNEIFLCKNDDPDHILNNPENFKKVTSTLNCVNIVINHKRVTSLIKEIENEESFICDDIPNF